MDQERYQIVFPWLEKISELTKGIEYPQQIPMANLTLDQIKKLKDEEIISILTGEKDVGGMLPIALQSTLTNELITRAIKAASKPHWTSKVGFWVSVVAALAACIAAFPILFPT